MASTSATEPRSAVLAALRAYLDAVEKKDADAVVAMFDDDPLTFDFAAPLENRAPELQGTQALRQWFEGWDGPIGTQLGEPTVEISGSLAVIYGLQRLHGRKKKEGEMSMWYRATLVMVHTHKGWRIRHLHHSVPMAMDGSEKALTQLQPPTAP